MIDELKKTVAENIVFLRTGSKLTQHELGEQLNYSDKAVSRWERADAVPDAYVLLRMSKIFGVTVDYLLTEHSENECIPAPAPKYRFNHHSVTLIAFLGVWSVALFVFIVLFLTGNTCWITFAYALPVSAVVLLVLNSVWGIRKNNFYIISLLIWSILADIYLSFLSLNIWIIFLLGIPAQIITLLCFHVRVKKK